MTETVIDTQSGRNLVTVDVSHDAINDQPVVDISHRRDISYQPHVDSLVASNPPSEMVVQPPPLNLPNFTPVEEYHNQNPHQQLGISQQPVICPAERLTHLAQNERYQYDGDTAGPATCIYTQHTLERNEVENDYQRQYYQPTSRNGKILCVYHLC